MIEWYKRLSIRNRRKAIERWWHAAEITHALTKQRMRDVCKDCVPIMLAEKELDKDIK